jgi:hypothetical protein
MYPFIDALEQTQNQQLQQIILHAPKENTEKPSAGA